MLKWPFRSKRTDTIMLEYQASRTMLEATELLKKQVESLTRDRDAWRATAEQYMKDYVQEVRRHSVQSESDMGTQTFRALRQKLEKQYAETAREKGTHGRPVKDSAIGSDQDPDVHGPSDVQ